MAHVRTQLRNAVIARLSAVEALVLVCPASRFERVLQSDEFPVAGVAVIESASAVGRGSPGQRPLKRDYSVQISVGLELVDDAEAVFDGIAVEIEKALADPSGLGIGQVSDWQFGGAGEGSAKAADHGLFVAPMIYRCSLTTLDSAPETNMHP